MAGNQAVTVGVPSWNSFTGIVTNNTNTGFLPQPQATVNSTTNLQVGALDPIGVPGQPNLSTLSSVTQYNGAYLGGGASSGYFEQDFNQAGTMAGGDQAVYGISRQLGPGATAEVSGGAFNGIISSGSAGQVDGVVGVAYVGGGTVQTTATVPGQVIGGLFGVQQSGGTVNGPMAGVLISAAQLTGGTTTGNIYGLRIDDQGSANFAIRSGNSATNAGVNFFGGTVWIASAGNEHPVDHAVFIAGGATATANFTILGSGIVNAYNNGTPRAARENGLPFSIQSVESDARTGNIAPLTLVANPTAGRYRLTAGLVVQIQATTSATLPVCNLIYTDVTTNQVTTQIITPATTALGANPAANSAIGGSGLADVAAGLPIQFSTTGYVSSGATPLTYKIYVILEML